MYGQLFGLFVCVMLNLHAVTFQNKQPHDLAFSLKDNNGDVIYDKPLPHNCFVTINHLSSRPAPYVASFKRLETGGKATLFLIRLKDEAQRDKQVSLATTGTVAYARVWRGEYCYEILLDDEDVVLNCEVGASAGEIKLVHEEASAMNEVVEQPTALEREHAKHTLSPEAEEEAHRLLEQIKTLGNDSVEITRITSYLKALYELPWDSQSDESCSLSQVKQVLDSDYFGLSLVKERILDFIGAHMHQKEMRKKHGQTEGFLRAPILCLVGPPGVGKTSLGKTIARSLNRRFQKISLGGIDDVSEIKGINRGYTGAVPGRIIQALQRAKSKNPLMVLDEIDKLGKNGHHGDPAAALLDVLDPEHNHSFVDYYINLPFSLAQVFFIATANDISSIPKALLDRMEVVEIPPYTLQEKIEIARRHLIPALMKEYAVEQRDLWISQEVLTEIVRCYAREAGVRKLEEALKTLIKKYARSCVESGKKINFMLSNLTTYLGPRKYSPVNDAKVLKSDQGCANFLYWSDNGPGLLKIEAERFKGVHHLTLLGNLYKKCELAAQIAYTHARNSVTNEIPKNYDIQLQIHMNGDEYSLMSDSFHSDGDSAGLAVYIALYSILHHKAIILQACALMGEITIQGKVLAVNKIKERILYAKQFGIKHLVIPADNKNEVEELGRELLGLRIHYVNTLKEAQEIVV